MSLSLKYKDAYIQALVKELKLRKNYLSGQTIETIYFGGGTPSLLNAKDLEILFDALYKEFRFCDKPEITLEANPEDLSPEYLQELRQSPINRLSIGLQSFFDEDLSFMNRRHTAKRSIAAVKDAQHAGFENISGDLIYGLPKMTSKKWEDNLSVFFDLRIPHLSAYHLSIEPNTVFYKKKKIGKLHEISEDKSLEQFEMLKQKASENNFIHYETSNFAKPDFFSRHNSAYWQQKHYLGIGASAHSYDGDSRQFNISNIKAYIRNIEAGSGFFEKEVLSLNDKYNDYLITSLRTLQGTDTDYILTHFGKKYHKHILAGIRPHIEQGNVLYKKNIIQISEQGKFTEDMILRDLFFV